MGGPRRQAPQAQATPAPQWKNIRAQQAQLKVEFSEVIRMVRSEEGSGVRPTGMGPEEATAPATGHKRKNCPSVFIDYSSSEIMTDLIKVYQKKAT